MHPTYQFNESVGHLYSKYHAGLDGVNWIHLGKRKTELNVTADKIIICKFVFKLNPTLLIGLSTGNPKCWPLAGMCEVNRIDKGHAMHYV